MFDILCPRLVAKIGVCCVTRSSTQHRRARLGSRLPVGGADPL